MKLSEKDNAILAILQDQQHKNEVKTRIIANLCDVDIYAARYSLLKLNKFGLVSIVKPGYWCIRSAK